jgi:hypothetical protein
MYSEKVKFAVPQAQNKVMNGLWGEDDSMFGDLGAATGYELLTKWNTLEARRQALPAQLANQVQQWTISSNGRSMPARAGDIMKGDTGKILSLFETQLTDYEKYLSTVEQAVAQGVPTEKIVTQQVKVSAIPTPVYIGAGVLALGILGYLFLKS